MRRDINGREVKSILKKYYPQAEFRVRIKKAGFDKTLEIRTDLLRYTREVAEKHYKLEWKLRREGELKGKESEEYNFYEELQVKDEQMKNRIREALKKHGIEEYIRRDQVTGEILLGCNLYIDIKPLE